MILLLESLQPLFRLRLEKLRLLTVGMERLVSECLLDGLPFGEELFGSLVEVSPSELLPDVFHRLVARMEHIFLVETIVSQLIIHNLVGREIAHQLWESLTEKVGSQEKRSLGELTSMESILRIADWTHRDDDALDAHIHQSLNSLGEFDHALTYRQLLLLEEALRTLLAVIHHLACLLQDIDMVGA